MDMASPLRVDAIEASRMELELEFKSRLEHRDNQIAEMRQTINELTTKLKLYDQLPDPRKLYEAKSRLLDWLKAMKNKLRHDGNAIGDSRAQFDYVYYRLTSQDQDLVLT
ncbi:hypothetical protein BKA67DRAFT_662798 [Truncatella angustata]|uniref:Uncharacterized protein n=1 Tax=Truncatella angustata TaxID=152316 RepID=A0A9P8UDS3_9PEZI|nr:uncharacterized protein BKA67DRAFT_662798 [Truncatella angustata]KAH6648067.1 hypothetical protein BKA67DRAFT_662798 [Truncatella angustata]